jgi:hypothetical protein
VINKGIREWSHARILVETSAEGKRRRREAAQTGIGK